MINIKTNSKEIWAFNPGFHLTSIDSRIRPDITDTELLNVYEYAGRLYKDVVENYFRKLGFTITLTDSKLHYQNVVAMDEDDWVSFKVNISDASFKRMEDYLFEDKDYAHRWLSEYWLIRNEYFIGTEPDKRLLTDHPRWIRSYDEKQKTILALSFIISQNDNELKLENEYVYGMLDFLKTQGYAKQI